MSIKTIVRREEEEEEGGEKNLLSGGLVLGAFLILVYAFPKYVTREEQRRRYER